MGQLRHLGSTERYTGHKVVALCKGNATVHERGILGFVVGVAVEEAPPGQLADLFGNETLFVETIAQVVPSVKFFPGRSSICPQGVLLSIKLV